MANQEIQEGNKLIAEFMGYELIENTSLKGSYTYRKKEERSKTGYFYSSIEYHQKYHENWNRLMPVVEKIKSLEKEFPVLTDHVVTLFIWKNINVVWKHVVEFIKQYNQNKDHDNVIN